MTSIRVTQQRPTIKVTPGDTPRVAVHVGAASRVRVANLGLQGPPGTRLVEVVYSVIGTVPANRTTLGYVATAPIDFIPANALARCGTANPVNTSFTLLDLDDVVLGTVDFLANQTVGTVSLNPTSLVAGEGLKIVHPASVSGMSDLVIILPANR